MEAPKLDWMYAGAAGHVNPEEYLTGRAVDKTFEQFKLGGCESKISDLPPQLLPRLKTGVPNVQVDVARKIQGDPLLDIMQQQAERQDVLREQRLIQQRLAPQTKKAEKFEKRPKLKKSKKKRSKSSSSSSSSSDLDEKLAKKLAKLKNKNGDESLDKQIAQKLKHFKKKRVSSSSSSSSSESEKEKSYSKKKFLPSKTDSGSSKRHPKSNYPFYERNDRREPAHQNFRHRSREETSNSQYNKSYSSSREERRRSRSQERKRSRSQERRRSRSGEKTVFRSQDEKRNYNEKEWKQKNPTTYKNQWVEKRQQTGLSMSANKRNGTKLSEEELEKRRKGMMQEAVVRDQERKVQVEKYRKEAEVEASQLSINRPKEAAFVKKHLASVASNSTVESRIKSNAFNINRRGDAMDSNFARR